MEITILGTGSVGSVLAACLLSSDLPISRLFLYDIDFRRATGHLIDLLDMRDVYKKETQISAGFGSSDVYIVAAGIPRRSSRDKHNHLRNLNIVLSLLASACDKDSRIYIVTNPVTELTGDLLQAGYKNVCSVGDLLDAARRKRTGHDPERTAELILDCKGETVFGCVADIIAKLRSDLK